MADEDSVKGWQPLPGKNEEEGIGKAEAMPSVHSADRSSYEEEKKPISSDGEDSRKRLDEVEVSHGDFNAQRRDASAEVKSKLEETSAVFTNLSQQVDEEEVTDTSPYYSQESDALLETEEEARRTNIIIGSVTGVIILVVLVIIVYFLLRALHIVR